MAYSSAGGEVIARMGFDAWGQRRDPAHDAGDWLQWLDPATPDWAAAMLNITPRGYTGHEHLDDHGIINMNGRIYDPHLGRFLQADPFMEDTGTLNRYTRKALDTHKLYPQTSDRLSENLLCLRI